MIEKKTNSYIQNNIFNRNFNSYKSFAYNIKEKPFNTNNTATLLNKFENIIKSNEDNKNYLQTKNNIIKKEKTLEKPIENIDIFKKDLLNKNLYLIYSSPNSKKITLIHNHNENRINTTNAIFINMFDLLKNEPDGSICKINNFIIKIPNKNVNLSNCDSRFTDDVTLKNGKKILISIGNTLCHQ